MATITAHRLRVVNQASPPLRKGLALGPHPTHPHAGLTAYRPTAERLVVCEASSGHAGVGSSFPSANPRPDRRERVRRMASQVAETLERMEAESPMASYDLQLPSTSTSSSGGTSLWPPSSASSSTGRRRRSSSSSRSRGEDMKYAGLLDATVSPPPPPPPPPRKHVAAISVCQGKACRKRGSDQVVSTLQQRTAGMHDVQVTGCKCLGQCKRGPAVHVEYSGGEEMIYVGIKGQASTEALATLVLDM